MANFLTTLWRRLTDKLLVVGSNRPVLVGGVSQAYQWSDDYDESIVRGGDRAKMLVRMAHESPEAKTALERISNDVYTNEDGSDRGWKITGVHGDDVREVLDKLSLDDARNLVWRMLAYGDSFLEISYNIRQREIIGFQLLPTWQMFRIQPATELLGFEQRTHISDSQPIFLHPIKVAHFRYNPDFLYGVSLFNAVVDDDWPRLLECSRDLAIATRELGASANVHIMPPGATAEQARSYIEEIRAMKKRGLVADMVVMNGGDVRKAGNNWNPFLNGLIDSYELRRRRIIMSSFVPQYLMGVDTKFASEVDLNARQYQRFINSVRASVADRFRYIGEIALALRGVSKPYRFEIEFPQWNKEDNVILDAKSMEYTHTNGVTK